MACDRCILRCSGEPRCGVVDVKSSRDLYPWMPVYMSLIPAEQIPLYHTCPGGLAARIVLPGAPWTCRVCFWTQYANPRSLILRRLDPGQLSMLKLSRPEILLVDGGEPLIHDWALKIPRKAREVLGPASPEVFATRTSGLVSLERIHKAREAGFEAIVFEYTLAVEKPPQPDHVLRVLEESYKLFTVVEIHFLHDGSKRANIMLSDLASRYPEAAIHAIPVGGEEASDRAYEGVERLRDKGHTNVYLYGDESYTLTDTLCRSCGKPLVTRKPWGVRVEGVEEGGLLRCRSCGRMHRIRVCKRPATRRAIHREVVIW